MEEKKVTESVEETEVQKETTPTATTSTVADKKTPSFFKKYDVLIIGVIVIAVAAIVFFFTVGSKVSDKKHEMGGYQFTISGRYHTTDEKSNSFAITNSRETVAMQVQSMSNDMSYSEFSKVIDSNKDFMIQYMKRQSPGISVDSIKKEKYDGKEVVVISMRNTMKSNQQGKIAYFAAPDDVVIMAVYAQSNGKIDDTEFKNLLKSVMKVEKAK